MKMKETRGLEVGLKDLFLWVANIHSKGDGHSLGWSEQDLRWIETELKGKPAQGVRNHLPFTLCVWLPRQEGRGVGYFQLSHRELLCRLSSMDERELETFYVILQTVFREKNLDEIKLMFHWTEGTMRTLVVRRGADRYFELRLTKQS